jgi:hypothetical protein
MTHPTTTTCECTPIRLRRYGCLCAFALRTTEESPEDERRNEEAASDDLARSHLEEQAAWDAENAKDLAAGWG